MNSILTNKDFENFWIRVYLSKDKGLTEAVIDRAYRDFNRTQHGISKLQTAESYNKISFCMSEIVKDILSKKINSRNDYDKWHEDSCNKIIKEYKTLLNYILCVGQAQKWINMSLKYLFALGESRISGVSANYEYFHIPIDNIIQDKLYEVYKIPKFEMPWSRINNYEKYLNYQNKIRIAVAPDIPMDIEFKLFNQ